MMSDELNVLEQRIKINADKLIRIGVKEWYRTRRKGKQPKQAKPQEDQVRNIEDKLVDPDE